MNRKRSYPSVGCKSLFGNVLKIAAVNHFLRISLCDEPLLETVGGQDVDGLLERVGHSVAARAEATVAQNLNKFLKKKKLVTDFVIVNNPQTLKKQILKKKNWNFLTVKIS